jgi:hypothetical protein
MVNVSMIPVFVHFPHPGDEHNPGNVRRQPWNTGNHRRKFLRSDGRYVAEDGSLYDASLVFWGEWEAPSYIVDCWLPEGRLPRFLHEPVWERPTTSGHRQNTDPWVFGDCFRYSNCKQLDQQLNPSALQRLTRGSIVLFGSTVDLKSRPRFVIDTLCAGFLPICNRRSRPRNRRGFPCLHN